MKIATVNLPDKDLQQFLVELNDLLDRYNYNLVPHSEYLSTGISLEIGIEKRLSKKKNG